MNISLHQKLATIYALLFVVVVISGYVPGLTNDQGLLLGLFKIHLQDDLLHTASALWASWSAWHSDTQSRFYFRWFGLYYTLDAFVGFFTGYTLIDVMTMNWAANHGFSLMNVGTNILVNLPHFIIGPLALYIGYRVAQEAQHKQA
jgi:hypothetical protein